jgi:pyruvate formate lyase activating enzyme
VLSFGTAGCNLGCKFCQNWDISKAKTQDRLMSAMMPNEIAALAQQYHSKSVAYTYNDPVIFAEYAIDTAKECRKRGIKNVAVSAGYITEQAREEFFEVMDAANIDLKGFTNEFYQKQSMAELKPVLNTLEYIVNHTKTWLEITTLLIPTLNDSDEELNHMTQWIRDYLGSNVPLHFSAFHPDFKLQNFEHTPKQTLIRAREIALKNGLNHVYVGNVHDKKDSSTYCSSCKKLLIERDWFELGEFHIKDGLCEFCLTKLPGIFENEIGQWGSKRIPISL